MYNRGLLVFIKYLQANHTKTKLKRTQLSFSLKIYTLNIPEFGKALINLCKGSGNMTKF